MKNLIIKELKNNEIITKLDDVIRIIIKHNRDGNYTDINIYAYNKNKNVCQYRITLNLNSSIMIRDE